MMLSHCLTARSLLFHGLLVLNEEEGRRDGVLQEALRLDDLVLGARV